MLTTHLNSASQIDKFYPRERIQFVDQIVPEDVTNISTIRDAWEDFEVEEEELEDEGEEEEMEDKIIESKVAGQLFTPHPRFPCLSEAVS